MLQIENPKSEFPSPKCSSMSSEPLRLLILGATGGTGRALIDQARTRGHQVTAFVRSPKKLGAPRDGVIVRRGDPLDAVQVRDVLGGHDAVLSALGAPGPGRTTILRDSSRVIVDALVKWIEER